MRKKLIATTAYYITHEAMKSQRVEYGQLGPRAKTRPSVKIVRRRNGTQTVIHDLKGA